MSVTILRNSYYLGAGSDLAPSLVLLVCDERIFMLYSYSIIVVFEDVKVK